MVYSYNMHTPLLHKDAWIAPSCDVIGNVTLTKDVSVFFHSVLRGDAEKIYIGEGSNIQDNCTLHCDFGHPLWIGKHVSVGHNCILHGCHIEDECLIGMGAIVMDGAYIEEHCIIGAGALIVKGMRIPKGSMVVGVPAKIVKALNEQQILSIQENAIHYQELMKQYREGGETNA